MNRGSSIMARGAWTLAAVAAAGAGLAAVVAFAPTPQRVVPPPADIAAPPPAPSSDAPGEPQRRRPAFDVVRVEPDGRALIAGVAEPGAQVEVLLDGLRVAEATADASGGFVAEVAVDPGEGLRRLELDARVGEGDATRSADPVFVNAPAIRAEAPAGDPASDPGPPPEAPLVVAARDASADVLQAEARPADAPVTLDLIAYAESGDVELRGRAAPGRRVRIYAGARPLAEASVGGDGRWTARAGADLAPGVHLLRIDEIEDGRVMSRIETPFKREAPQAAALAEGEVVVQPGDSLWRIAQARYGAGVRYLVIYEANADRIRDPDLIYPGQVFATPPTP